jgi:hypothetical protein
MKRPTFVAAGIALVAASASLAAGPASAERTARPGDIGSFGPVFAEPTGHECADAQDVKAKRCKPAAVTMLGLTNGKIAYWDGLEGMNKAGLNVVAEFGNVAMSDQARVLDVQRRKWAMPTPGDSGTNPDGYDKNAEYLPLVPHDNDNKANDGNLFCASVNQLADGRTLITGGTAYYSEPSVPGTGYGVVELEGIRNSRIFNGKDNTFRPSGDMTYGRWYPATVTLPDSKVFVTSGVTKLIKPAYAKDRARSLTNVKQTETYNPATGKWKLNPSSADKSLPLFPRIHLLPNGKVYYDAGGQTFNPAGQSYDEALWNMTSVYDPKRKSWKDLGLPMIGGLPLGFRGSGFSVMLPLAPDAGGKYRKAQFLSGGGVIGTSPGTYIGNASATLNTVDTSGAQEKFTSKSTGNLHTPRWYASGVVLPDGKVFVANGASADEVVAPGTGFPVRSTEIWDPKTGEWTETASQQHDRTYHNTAMLLPDGRVLLGGHAPIGTGYLQQRDEPRELLGMSRATGDPSFQIYSPPYLHRGKRPVITKAPSTVVNNRTLTVAVDSPSKVSSVRLVRNTALTHLVDADQRSVVLRVVKRSGNTVTLAVPNREVVPAGPYLLFANRQSAKGEIPSVSEQVMVSAKAPTKAVKSPKTAPSGDGAVPTPDLPETPALPDPGQELPGIELPGEDQPSWPLGDPLGGLSGTLRR